MAERSIEEWSRELRAIARTTLPAELRREAIRAALDGEGKAKRRISGTPLHSRTGLLRRSIRGTVPAGRDAGDVVVRLEASPKYAATHEYGATIKPTRSRYLAIPLGAMKTRAGVSRVPSPRSVPDAFFWQSKAGNKFIARARPDGGIEPLFLLREQVRIKARPFIRPSLAEAAAGLRRRLGAAVRRAAREAERRV